MTFPFDIINWLFGIKDNPGQAQSSGSGIGGWFRSIGANIASGLEGGFIAILKDLWDTIRPVTYIALGVIIMVLASFWMFTGSGNLQTVVSTIAMVAK